MNREKEKLLALLQPYKHEIDRYFEREIPNLDSKHTVRDACEYALLNGGKRLRPAIVYMIGEALEKPKRAMHQAAASVEMFHAASLIADDLPCMDDDDERRGKPSLHKKYGEAVALLSGFSLFSAGFEYISKIENIEEERYRCLLSHAGRLNGIQCLIYGQYLDLFAKNINEEKILEIIEKKTASLFELAFLYGWVVGGGSLDHIQEIQQAAYHFGAAFQILDDIGDADKDAQASHKANYANLFGKKEAAQAVHTHVESFISIFNTLSTHPKPLIAIAQGLAVLSDL